MANPYVAALNKFDPARDLLTEERFSTESSTSDLLGNTVTPAGNKADVQIKPKKQILYKTSDAIAASLLPLEDDTFLAVNRHGSLYLLKWENQKIKKVFAANSGSTLLKRPAESNGAIYSASREGLLVAMALQKDESGKYSGIKSLWKTKLPKGVLSEPVTTGKTLFVSSLAGLYAYEAWYNPESNSTTGRKLWFHDTGVSASSPALSGGVLYLGNEKGELHAVEFGGTSVSSQWIFPAKSPIRTKPLISDKTDYIVFGTQDGFLYAVDRQSARKRWALFLDAPVFSGVAAGSFNGQEHYYVGSDKGVFYAVDTFGKKVWSFRTNGKIRSEPMLLGNAVIFGSGDNQLYGLDRETGKLLFQYGTDGDILGTPIALNNALIFGSADSFIHAIPFDSLNINFSYQGGEL